MSEAPANPWEAFARQSRDMLESQAALTRSWLEGQSKLAEAMGEAQKQGAGSAEAMQDLWRSWFSLGSAFGQAMPGMADSGKVAGETLGRMMDPMSLMLVGGSQVGETIRRLTEGPRLADLGSIERRMGRLMEQWLAVQAAARAYEAVVAGAWGEATRRYGSEMAELQRRGTAPADAKAALKSWLDIANRTLLETHRSPRFLEAQGELLRKGMEFLLVEREVVEAMVEPAGLPTRSEIDEVHRSLQDLKRRVRTLEKSTPKVDGKPEKAAALAAKPARKPAVRKPSARKPRRKNGEAA
ncbi:MAG TPA: poly(R)-hydroxyalkanoic acid synthase subunit PhaE [Propylenella sp.]|nr:poly(R)-hydroxyalkanoic acid synthase subunit PhaE [Propylenella sp.]